MIDYNDEKVLKSYVATSGYTIRALEDAIAERDEITVLGIESEYFDDEGNLLSQENLDLEKLVFNIFEHFQTFDRVEDEMLKAYHADH